MNKEIKDYLRVNFKLFILELAKESGRVRKVCKDYGVNRTSFYNWKKKYKKEGRQGLYRKKPYANKPFLNESCHLPMFVGFVNYHRMLLGWSIDS